MKIEILVGLITISGFAIWAIVFVKKSTKDANQHIFDFIPHLFPTLGILFTFLGIAIGLWNFDSNNIEKSIPELMNGLKSAFLVSIFGVALLVFFSFWTNYKKRKFEDGILSNETIAINKLIELLTEFKNDFSSKDEKGNLIKPGNVFRDIYEENNKQSKALQTFSTDLALTISAGFEQILNNPNEGVVAELKLLKSETEKLGKNLQDPTAEMTQNVVKDLQESMKVMLEEFKVSISGSATSELEQLTKLLSQAGGSLTDFPTKLQVMTDNLNNNFRGLQDMVQQISQQTFSQSEQSTNQMRIQVEEMSEILKRKVGDLQIGQETLLTKQSENLQVSDSLLDAFNTSIEKMNGLSREVTGSITRLNHVQREFENLVGAFRNISQDVNASSSKFGESQLTFSRYSNEFMQNNSSTIREIQKSLSTAKEVSADYALKFDIIEKGLQGIFATIDTGLKDYQTTISESLQTFLGKYSEHLTKTAESLAAASSKQAEILEELTEQLSHLNGSKN